MKKLRKRTLAFLMVLALIVSSVVFSSMSASALGEKAPGAQDVVNQIIKESSILFKNNGALPLNPGAKAAIFGRIQVNTIRGGTGSGNVNVTLARTAGILDGIQQRGKIAFYEPLASRYREWCAANPATDPASGAPMSFPEMPLTNYQDLVEGAKAYTDTAIVVIGRIGGEFADRKLVNDYYLQDTERDMLQTARDNFEKVIVVLNIASVIDMNWVDEYNPDAILNVWLPGPEGGPAVADLLVGDAYPSGKLTDTWAKNYTDYPTQDAVINEQFGGSTWGKSYNANNVNTNPHYAEDVYVGYRYFETFAPEKVAYEFGFGKTYTDFEMDDINVDYSGVSVTGSAGAGYTIRGKVNVTANVKNVGYYPGKEVVQIYYGAPNGTLGQPVKQLVAFAKTDELQPGQSQVVTVSFDASDMASYDDSGVTGYKSCYVMENGDYKFYVGNSVKNVELADTYNLTTGYGLPVVVERLSEQLAVEQDKQFKRLVRGANNEMTFQDVPTRTVPWADITYDDGVALEYNYDPNNIIQLLDVYNDPSLMDAYIAQFSDLEMATMTGGGGTSTRVSGAAGRFGAWNSGSVNTLKFGITQVVVADGPAGIRINRASNGEGNTQFPNATAVASTWNLDLIEQEGIVIGTEGYLNEVDIWLAPGMNIHRDPLSGRNFEYYSEDPLITGLSAAAVVRGVQSQGMQVTIKHYAGNNQEQSRQQNNSIASERAYREIYLKGFEIAVKQGKATGVMTAYNKMNGSFGASNYESLTNILHKEWGFDGLVMTDWGGSKDNGQGSMVRAQCDLSMSSGNASQVTSALSSGLLTRWQLQRSIKNIVNSVMASNYWRDENGLPRNLMTYDKPLTDITRGEVVTWYDFASDAYKSLLGKLIDIAEPMVGGDDYNISFQFIRDNFDRALANAKEVYAELYVTDDQVDAAFKDLFEAIGLLGTKEADKSELAILIEIAEGIDLSKYLPAGQPEFQAALLNARDVYDDEIANQDEVTAAVDDLLQAMVNLKLKADKARLRELINAANTFDLAIYTEDSGEALLKALKSANTADEDENVSQDEVNQIAGALSNAMTNLVLRTNGGGSNNDDGNGNGGNGNGNGDGTNNNSNVDTNNNTNTINTGTKATNTGDKTKVANTGTANTPKTGDSTPIMLIFLVMGAACMVIFKTKHTAVKKNK